MADANLLFSAVLNVCFPYTSRNEITTAIRETVHEFSQPIRPTMKRPFSESHIARNIRTRQLSSVSEERLGFGEENAAEGDDTEASTYSAASTGEQAPSSQSSVSNSPSLKPSAFTSNFPDPESITGETLNSHMFTADAPPVDLLVRTSGVRRLSDFMLWQCHEHTSIVFLECLWPEFDLWQFLPVLVEWQWKQRNVEEAAKITADASKLGLKVQ